VSVKFINSKRGRYNFDGITFPTPLSDITKFENNNLNMSLNVYGLDKVPAAEEIPDV